MRHNRQKESPSWPTVQSPNQGDRESDSIRTKPTGPAQWQIFYRWKCIIKIKLLAWSSLSHSQYVISAPRHCTDIRHWGFSRLILAWTRTGFAAGTLNCQVYAVLRKELWYKQVRAGPPVCRWWPSLSRLVCGLELWTWHSPSTGITLNGSNLASYLPWILGLD